MFPKPPLPRAMRTTQPNRHQRASRSPRVTVPTDEGTLSCPLQSRSGDRVLCPPQGCGPSPAHYPGLCMVPVVTNPSETSREEPRGAGDGLCRH